MDQFDNVGPLLGKQVGIEQFEPPRTTMFASVGDKVLSDGIGAEAPPVRWGSAASPGGADRSQAPAARSSTVNANLSGIRIFILPRWRPIARESPPGPKPAGSRDLPPCGAGTSEPDDKRGDAAGGTRRPPARSRPRRASPIPLDAPALPCPVAPKKRPFVRAQKANEGPPVPHSTTRQPSARARPNSAQAHIGMLSTSPIH